MLSFRITEPPRLAKNLQGHQAQAPTRLILPRKGRSLQLAPAAAPRLPATPPNRRGGTRPPFLGDLGQNLRSTVPQLADCPKLGPSHFSHHGSRHLLPRGIALPTLGQAPSKPPEQHWAPPGSGATSRAPRCGFQTSRGSPSSSTCRSQTPVKFISSPARPALMEPPVPEGGDSRWMPSATELLLT